MLTEPDDIEEKKHNGRNVFHPYRRHDLQASRPLGAQSEGKEDDRKSLLTKLRNTFHVSAAEIDEQDTHQVIVIGIAAVVPHQAMADSLMEQISLFVEENCEAEILEETRDLR